MQPNGLALLGRTYAPGSQKKNMAFALFGAMAPTGAYSGVLFGSLFAQLTWWPWMFFTSSIVCIILACLAHVILPAPKPARSMISFTENVRKMDWLGAFTGIAALVVMNVAWNCAAAYGWHTQWIFMLLILGLILAAGFVLIETKIAEQPMLPFKILKIEVGFVLAAVGLGWASFGIWLYYTWQYLLLIRQNLPLEATAQFLPILPVGILATAITGHLLHKMRPAWILTMALAAFTTGSIFMLGVRIDQTYWSLTFLSLMIIPFGMDMSFPAATVIMSNAVPKDKQGIAGSLVATVVNYSVSLGLGFAATVEVQINNDGRTPNDVLIGFRGAWGMATTLGALGLLVAIAFLVKGYLQAGSKTLKRNHRSTRITGPLGLKKTYTDKPPQTSHTCSSEMTVSWAERSPTLANFEIDSPMFAKVHEIGSPGLLHPHSERKPSSTILVSPPAVFRKASR